MQVSRYYMLNLFETPQNNNFFLSTYVCRALKKCVKLKSCRVGCVFSVRFGNVEKNAFASRAATKL